MVNISRNSCLDSSSTQVQNISKFTIAVLTHDLRAHPFFAQKHEINLIYKQICLKETRIQYRAGSEKSEEVNIAVPQQGILYAKLPDST